MLRCQLVSRHWNLFEPSDQEALSSLDPMTATASASGHFDQVPQPSTHTPHLSLVRLMARVSLVSILFLMFRIHSILLTTGTVPLFSSIVT